MTHNGSIGNKAVPEQIHDIRGTNVRDADDTTLGQVADVIVDHETMEIQYLVMDSQGWLEAATFLLPAGRVSADEKDDNNLAASVTRQQIEDAPQYDQESLDSEDKWKKYEQAFKEYWDEAPVMHIKGSDRIITTPERPESVRAGSSVRSAESDDREVSVANFFPERMTPVFSDPTPGSGKVTLRPKSVARAEEAASGVSMLKPRWWESFENYLRLNKEDVQAKCPQCSSKAA